MGLLSIPELTAKASAAFKRFPFTLLWAIAGSIFVIVLLEIDENKLFDRFLNLFLILMLGISWLISAQFYSEQFKNPKGQWWVKIVVLLFLAVVYITLPKLENQDYGTTHYIRYALLVVAGHLALFFAPFTFSWHSKSYANYLGTMLLSLARAVLFAGVLYLGLVLALAAVDFLFNVTIDGKRYGQLFVLCLGIVNTWVYLSDFPKEVHHNIHFSFPKPAEVFVKYILIPLVALYFVILYAYSAKIIFEWELPNGWVSYLVTALSGLIFVIQLIINPVQKSHPSRLIRKFHPLFYWLLLPLLGLLFVAIYRRTSEYGITENRYFVWALAFFILIATLYLLFSRKRQLRWLPMGLFVIALIASIGPWSASSVSIRSQVNQFEKLYDDAFAKAQTQEKTMEAAAYDRFQSITRYLINRDAIHKTEGILGFNPKEQLDSISKWQITRLIMDSIGVKRGPGLYERRDYFSVNYDAPLEISGFDYYKQINLNRNSNNRYNEILGYTFYLEEGKNEIRIEKGNTEMMHVSLDTLRDKLLTIENKNIALRREQLLVNASNDSIAFRFYFNDITFEKKPKDNRIIAYGTVDVLLKELKHD